jgi:hypothetical protein
VISCYFRVFKFRVRVTEPQAAAAAAAADGRLPQRRGGAPPAHRRNLCDRNLCRRNFKCVTGARSRPP